MFFRKGFLIAAAAASGFFLWNRNIQPVRAAGPGDVVINELQWMGSSRSAADEWIELRNMTDTTIPLDNWTIFKKSNGKTVPMLTIPAGKSIPARGFFLIANYAETNANSILGVTPDLVLTDVALVNSDLQVTLADASSATIDIADDGLGTPLAGKFISGQTWQAMERDFVPGDGQQKESWHTASSSVNLQPGAELATPKTFNSNQPPELHGLTDRDAAAGESIPFDVSESLDPEGDSLTFRWDFGDGSQTDGATPVHVYEKPGVYHLEVAAIDGQVKTLGQATVTVHAVVANRPEPKPTPGQPSAVQPTISSPAVVPSDTSASDSTKTSQSSGAAAGDSSKTGTVRSADLRFSEIFPDPAGVDTGQEFIELVQTGSKSGSSTGWQVAVGKQRVALPAVTLQPGQFLVLQADSLTKRLPNAGATYLLYDQSGKKRDGVRVPVAKTNQSFSRIGQHWVWTDPTAGELNSAPPQAGEAKSADQQPDLLSIADARQADANTKLRISGTVIVPPGTLSSREFLLGDETGSMIIALDRAHVLKAGEQITLAAKKSSAQEPRLRATASSIVSGSMQNVSAPATIALNEVGDDQVGTLVRIIGVVGQKHAHGFALTDDTGNLAVGQAAGKLPDKGGRVVATGVVRLINGNVRLQALSVESAPVDSAAADPQPKVFSATATTAAAHSTPLVSVKQPNRRLAYVLIGVAGALLGLRTWWLVKTQSS